MIWGIIIYYFYLIINKLFYNFLIYVYIHLIISINCVFILYTKYIRNNLCRLCRLIFLQNYNIFISCHLTLFVEFNFDLFFFDEF